MPQKRQSNKGHRSPNSNRPPAPPPTILPPLPTVFSSLLHSPQYAWYPPGLLPAPGAPSPPPVSQYQALPPFAADGVQQEIVAVQRDFIHTTPVNGEFEQTQSYRVSVQPLGPPQLTRIDPRHGGRHLQENTPPVYSHQSNRRPMNHRQGNDSRPRRGYQHSNNRRGSPMNGPSMIGYHDVQYGHRAQARTFNDTARVTEVEDMEAQTQRHERSSGSRRESYNPTPRAPPKVRPRSYSSRRVEPPSRTTSPKFQDARASMHIRGRGGRAQEMQSHSTFGKLGKHAKRKPKSEPTDQGSSIFCTPRSKEIKAKFEPRSEPPNHAGSISRTSPRKEVKVKLEPGYRSPDFACSGSRTPPRKEVKVKFEPRSESPEPMSTISSFEAEALVKPEPEYEPSEPVISTLAPPALVEAKAMLESPEPMNPNPGARDSRYVTTSLAGLKRKRDDCSDYSYCSYEADYQEDEEFLEELFKKVKLD